MQFVTRNGESRAIIDGTYSYWKAQGWSRDEDRDGVPDQLGGVAKMASDFGPLGSDPVANAAVVRTAMQANPEIPTLLPPEGALLALDILDDTPVNLSGKIICTPGARALHIRRPLGTPIAVTVTRLFQFGATGYQGSQLLSKITATNLTQFRSGDAFHISSDNRYSFFGDDAGTDDIVTAGFLTVLGVGMDMPTVTATPPVEYLMLQGATTGASGLVSSSIPGAGGAARQVLFASVTGTFQPGEDLAVISGGSTALPVGTVVGTAGATYLLKSGDPFADSYGTMAQLRRLNPDATCKLDITVVAQGDTEAYLPTRREAVVVAGQFAPDVVARIRGAYSKALRILSCYGGTVQPRVVGSLPNHTSADAYGYGVTLDGATTGVDVINPWGRDLRHLVTTNTNYTADWTSDGIVNGINKLLEWGAPTDNTVHGGHGRDCTGAVYDTHPGARGTTFIGSYAKASSGAGRTATTRPNLFTNRGTNTTWKGCVADGGGFLDSSLGTVVDFHYVNTIDGCTIKNFGQYGISHLFDARSDGAGSYYGTLRIVDTDISGDGQTGPYTQSGIYLAGGRVIVERARISKVNGPPVTVNTSGSGSIFELDLDLDWSDSPTLAPMSVTGTLADASIAITYRTPAGLPSLINNVSGSTNWKLEDLRRRGSVNVPILLNEGGGSQVTAANQIAANSRTTKITAEATVTLTPRSSGQIIRWDVPLTQDRVIQMSAATGAHIAGDWFEIIRSASATGAFNLIVKNAAGTTIKTLTTPGTAMRARHDGTDYYSAGTWSL